MPDFATAPDRLSLWTDFLREQGVASMAEIGVHRGKFAAHVLANVPGISRYVMIDPWRNIPDWNKPLNKHDDAFEAAYNECMAATDFAGSRRQVLRGKTSEVIGRIADGSLDFAYIDGDHTLRGITVDLLAVYPKVREGGWIAGDDFCRSIWQHDARFEPSLVFPLAVHFAEGMGLTIQALPHDQFLIRKQAGRFEFVDTVGGYGDLSLHAQLAALRTGVSPGETAGV
jgi:hypothetical protein